MSHCAQLVNNWGNTKEELISKLRMLHRKSEDEFLQSFTITDMEQMRLST